MEWFGITMYGFSDPFKDLIRVDYKEPEKQSKFVETNEMIQKPTRALVSGSDCYFGHDDGYAYRSYNRLLKMRKKGATKPVGPHDMYKYPATNAMKYGWWLEDPDIVGKKWYRPRCVYPVTTSEMSRYLNKARETDKYFRL